MKRTFILPVAAVIATSFVFTSCQPSRVWANKKKKENKEYREPEVYRQPAPAPPPRYYASSALIISPSPGFVMKQHPSGRFYHRSSRGYLYWKGYDNRFYIDQSYLSSISYSRWEYDEWRRYSRQSR
ncbi:MAG: hypothetical protein ACT4OJ_02515 [Bacteroidota bacterium]